jgi:hypothetical protein
MSPLYYAAPALSATGTPDLTLLMTIGAGIVALGAIAGAISFAARRQAKREAPDVTDMFLDSANPDAATTPNAP